MGRSSCANSALMIGAITVGLLAGRADAQDEVTFVTDQPGSAISGVAPPSEPVLSPAPLSIDSSPEPLSIAPPVESASWLEPGGACGDDCGCTECCSPACCKTAPRSYVFGEYLFLAPGDADVTHAQQQDGIGGAGTVPAGDIGTIGFDYESGFRVGAGFAIDQLSSIGVSYTFFESDSFDIVVPPAVVGGGAGAVGSLVQLPNAAITASVGPVTATYAIDFQLGDVVFRDVWMADCDYELRYLIGAQYGNLDQEFAQNGIFGGGAGGTIDTSTDIEYDGGGLKFGLEGERRLRHGFYVYGRATAAAMVGRFNAEFNQVNSTTAVNLGNAVWSDDRFVTQVEYEVGLALTTSNQKLRLSAGFLASHWDDVVTTDEFIQAVQTNNYVDVDGELSFNGLVGRVEYRW